MVNPANRPTVTQGDAGTALWQQMAAWMMSVRKAALIEITTPGLDATKTEFQRGRLALADEFLGLTDKPPNVQTGAGDYGFGDRIEPE